MKLYPNKLEAHLKSQTAPVYFLYGDEPLQVMEIGDRLRQHAREQGFDEREVIVITEDSDWSQFRESADSLSLFSAQRLIELRIPTGKPGRTGADVLKQYCESPPPDLLLLITSGRLDRGATTSAWFKAIDKAGAVIGVQPLTLDQLRGWLKQRLMAQGLVPEAAALALIAERTEGNLLAASQEVERLSLLVPPGPLDSEHVLAAVGNSARYNIGDLTLACLQGESLRALRILAGLYDEAVADVLILWSLSQEVRAGARAGEAHAQGASLDAALKAAGVWPKRAGPLKQAIARHTPDTWLRMLSLCTLIDRQIKGQAAGRVRDSFERLCVALSSQGHHPVLETEERFNP